MFRRLVCSQKSSSSCRQCVMSGVCSYSIVFSTVNNSGSDLFIKNHEIPRPFLFDFKDNRRFYRAGEEIELSLTLIGRAIDYFPYFFITLRELGKRGFGLKDESGKSGHYEIIKVIEENGSVIYRCEEPHVTAKLQDMTLGVLINGPYDEVDLVKIKLLTPLRLKYEGRLCSRVEFHHLMLNILRRIAALYYFSEGKPLEIDHKEIIESAKKVETLDSHFQWYDYYRYSGHQKNGMYLGGITGWAEYDGKQIKKFIPLLRVAEVIAIGKAATFGFGRIAVEVQA